MWSQCGWCSFPEDCPDPKCPAYHARITEQARRSGVRSARVQLLIALLLVVMALGGPVVFLVMKLRDVAVGRPVKVEGRR